MKLLTEAVAKQREQLSADVHKAAQQRRHREKERAMLAGLALGAVLGGLGALAGAWVTVTLGQ